MQRRWVAMCPKPCAADRPLGNSVGAIGSVVWRHPGLASGALQAAGGALRQPLCLYGNAIVRLREEVPHGLPWVLGELPG
jgi:hypothetical protein